MYFDTMIILLLGSGVILRDIYADSSSCYDMRGDCETLQKIGYCDKESAMMQGVCGKTCGLCGKKISAKKPTEPRRKITINACKNHRTDCSLLSEAGWCQLRQSLMSQLCGPACGFCEESNENVVSVTIGARTITTRAPITQPYYCRDSRSDCKKLATVFGMCVTRKAAMKVVCPVTCNYCPRKTVNKDITSAPSKRKMLSKTLRTISTTKSTAAAKRALRCKDYRGDCKRLGIQFGWCRRRKILMKQVCPYTCNLCDTYKNTESQATAKTLTSTSLLTGTTAITLSSHKSCHDTRSDCHRIGILLNWCNIQKAAMLKYCSASCQFCRNNGKEKPTTTLLTNSKTTIPPATITTTKQIAPTKLKPASNCFDKRTDCHRLAHVFKWCVAKRSAMQLLCARTCNYCHRHNKKPTKATTTKLTTRTTTTKVVPTTAENTATDCTDTRDDCARLSNEFGWCVSKRSVMEKVCAVTCNACVAKKKKEITFAPPEVPATPRVPVCEDKMEGCSFIKKRGWCTRRKSAFETRCRKTCGFCAPCSDSRPDCFKYKSNGWCETKKPLMVGVCPRTCGLCSMVPAKPKGESCKDKNAGCQKMKKIGFCKSRKATMKKLCPGTCGFCTPGNGASAAVSATTTAPTAPKTTRRRVMGCSDAYGAERCNYYSHLGWCEKYDRIRKNCDDTCRCNYVAPTKLPQSQKCNETPHGCCWDKKTAKRDANGSDCPECSDDKRFTVLCARFGDDCTSSGSLAKSLHKYCPKTCKMC